MSHENIAFGGLIFDFLCHSARNCPEPSLRLAVAISVLLNAAAMSVEVEAELQFGRCGQSRRQTAKRTQREKRHR